MNDVEKWKARGPVKTLRTEFAMWDLDQNEWQPVRHWSLARFLPGGTISATDTHNSDGSVAHSRWLYDESGRLKESNFRLNDGPIGRSIYSYDEAGRHQRTTNLNPDGSQAEMASNTYDVRGLKKSRCSLPRADSYGVEGTDVGYGAPGAAIMITTYDEQTLPAKVLFQDANGRPLREVTFVRDTAGRLLKEEMRFGADSLLDNVPEESREEFAAAFAKAFGDTFSSTIYAYDSRGRRIERKIELGSLQSRTTWHYDNRDDPIGETGEEINRERTADDTGAERYSSDRVTVQHTRFDYAYDAHGNWTERIVSGRLDPNSEFQRSNIERRMITYY